MYKKISLSMSNLFFLSTITYFLKNITHYNHLCLSRKSNNFNKLQSFIFTYNQINIINYKYYFPTKTM